MQSVTAETVHDCCDRTPKQDSANRSMQGGWWKEPPTCQDKGAHATERVLLPDYRGKHLSSLAKATQNLRRTSNLLRTNENVNAVHDCDAAKHNKSCNSRIYDFEEHALTLILNHEQNVKAKP
jgi:hypothetical protein